MQLDRHARNRQTLLSEIHSTIYDEELPEPQREALISALELLQEEDNRGKPLRRNLNLLPEGRNFTTDCAGEIFLNAQSAPKIENDH